MSSATYRAAEAPPGFPPYVSSGKTPIVGLVMGVVAGVAAALMLAVLYAYGTLYIPIVQIEVLLTIAFGAAVGAATAGVMHAFKVRSRSVIVAAACALGVLAWGVSWLPWIYGTMHRFDVPVSAADVIDPVFLATSIARIYDVGTWGIGSSASSAVSGVALGVVWLGEAALIVGFSTGVGFAMTKDRVFCEACETWCTIAPDRALYDLQHGETLRAAIVERGDLEVLDTTPRARAQDVWLALKLAHCPRCGETGVIAIEHVTKKVDQKGNTTYARGAFMDYRLVPRGQMRGLRDRFPS